ncbi:ATP-binding protein [Chloroflexota bacterium]
MGNHRVRKKRTERRHYMWQIAVITLACALLYYLPVMVGFLGFTSAGSILSSFHDFVGIDFYALVFFAPVVYAAYVVGIGGAIAVALAATFVILPYSILIDTYPNVLFKPTAFAIILSAVGAVVAMLQKSDEQRRRSVRELKCLYDIGKAAEEANTVEDFLSSVMSLLPEVMQYPEETGIRITVRDSVYQGSGVEELTPGISEELRAGGELVGSLEVRCVRNSLLPQQDLVRTVAERISGAIHGIELEQSLRTYYEQLEDIVEKRTRDLEQVQEKLIRSERLAAVGELASGVGHELRNPLNVIRNCAYLLHMSLDEADEEAKDTLNVLDKQIDIANRIVTDLLDFTRIKPPQRTEFNLSSLVKESLSWVVIPEKVKLTADLNGKSADVYADSEQVGRAFANIVSNAVQAMNGKGQLKITSGTEADAAWVSFEDNGCGIPQENLGKIFEPLFTTKPKGIGLGLAITRRLVEQNRGKIEVASEVAKGTLFTIRLPLQKKRKEARDEGTDKRTGG